MRIADRCLPLWIIGPPGREATAGGFAALKSKFDGASPLRGGRAGPLAGPPCVPTIQDALATPYRLLGLRRSVQSNPSSRNRWWTSTMSRTCTRRISMLTAKWRPSPLSARGLMRGGSGSRTSRVRVSRRADVRGSLVNQKDSPSGVNIILELRSHGIANSRVRFQVWIS